MQLLAAAKAGQHGPHQIEDFGQSAITTGELNDKLDQILQLLRPPVVAWSPGAMDTTIWDTSTYPLDMSTLPWTTGANPLDQGTHIWNTGAIPFEPGPPCPPFPPGQGDPGERPTPTEEEKVQKGKVGFNLEANTFHTWDLEARDFMDHTLEPETAPEARDAIDDSESATVHEARDTFDYTAESETVIGARDTIDDTLESETDHGGEYCLNCDRWAPRCQCGASEQQFGSIQDEGLYLCSECLSTADRDLIWPCNGTSRVHERPRNFFGEGGMYHQDCMMSADHLPGCEYMDDPLFLCRACVETATPTDCPGCKIASARTRSRPRKRKPK